MRFILGFSFLQHMNAHQAYEAQISSMAKALSKLEEQRRHDQDEKALILSDLASVRELCVKLDSSKEQFSRQLTSRNMEYERVSVSPHVQNTICIEARLLCLAKDYMLEKRKGKPDSSRRGHYKLVTYPLFPAVCRFYGNFIPFLSIYAIRCSAQPALAEVSQAYS